VVNKARRGSNLQDDNRQPIKKNFLLNLDVILRSMLESEASEAVEGWGGLWNSWGPGVLCPILSGTGQRLYENFKKKGLSSKMRFA